MDGSCVTDKTSKAYKLIQTLEVDDRGHYHDGKYLAAAFGTKLGNIGDKFKITLSTGKVIYCIKADIKDDRDTINGIVHKSDGSIIEFIVDTDKALKHYGTISNKYVLNGNFNNHDDFKGNVEKIEKLTYN